MLRSETYIEITPIDKFRIQLVASGQDGNVIDKQIDVDHRGFNLTDPDGEIIATIFRAGDELLHLTHTGDDGTTEEASARRVRIVLDE